MRVRALIEKGTDEDVADGRPVLLSEVDTEGHTVAGMPVGCASVDEARAAAEDGSGGLITMWKNPPPEWLPDAILVSNYYEEEGWSR